MPRSGGHANVRSDRSGVSTRVLRDFESDNSGFPGSARPGCWSRAKPNVETMTQVGCGRAAGTHRGEIMSRRFLAVAIVAIALAFSALPPASAMTTDYARQYFLNSVCPGRAKAVALNQAVFRGKSNFTGKQMHGKRLRQARRAVTAMRTAEANAAMWLRNPPSEWPSQDAAAAIAKAANALARETVVLGNLRTKAGKRFRSFWNNRFHPGQSALRRRLEAGPHFAGSAIGSTRWLLTVERASQSWVFSRARTPSTRVTGTSTLDRRSTGSRASRRIVDPRTQCPHMPRSAWPWTWSRHGAPR